MYKKGFTLIELLVVIAIIGLLSAVVIKYLSDAKFRGENAAIKTNLHSARSQMDLNYSTSNTYSGLCTSDPKLVTILQDASLRGGGNTTSYVCNSNTSTWAISTPLKISEGSNTYWCVDSTGNAKSQAANLSSGVMQCL